MIMIVDVAAYILRMCGTMTTMKLEKLVFYSQAQSLVSCSQPLFEADFEAWRNGPVSPELFALHKGQFLIYDGDLTSHDTLKGEECTIIDMVCQSLSPLSGNTLSSKVCSEEPWKTARHNLNPDATCHTIISKTLMKNYYTNHPIMVDSNS